MGNALPNTIFIHLLLCTVTHTSNTIDCLFPPGLSQFQRHCQLALSGSHRGEQLGMLGGMLGRGEANSPGSIPMPQGLWNQAEIWEVGGLPFLFRVWPPNQHFPGLPQPFLCGSLMPTPPITPPTPRSYAICVYAVAEPAKEGKELGISWRPVSRFWPPQTSSQRGTQDKGKKLVKRGTQAQSPFSKSRVIVGGTQKGPSDLGRTWWWLGSQPQVSWGL